MAIAPAPAPPKLPPPLVNVAALPTEMLVRPEEPLTEPAAVNVPVVLTGPMLVAPAAAKNPELVPEVLVTNAVPPPGPATVAAMLLVTDTAPPPAAPATEPAGLTVEKVARAFEVDTAVAWALPNARPLPVVCAKLPTVPVVLALPATAAPPALPVGPLTLPLTAPAVAAASELAALKLIALPVPALKALDWEVDNVLVVVAVAAKAVLLTVAEAIPASNATDMAIRVFFMIIPSI